MERKNVNEWAEWNGGEMPVPKGTPIGVRHRDGGEYRELAGARYAESWDLRGVGSDIVAWRLLGADEGWVSLSLARRAPHTPSTPTSRFSGSTAKGMGR